MRKMRSAEGVKAKNVHRGGGVRQVEKWRGAPKPFQPPHISVLQENEKFLNS